MSESPSEKSKTLNSLTALLLRLKESAQEKVLAIRLETPKAPETKKGGANKALNWQTLTWQEFGQRVRQMAAGLLSLGLKKGHRLISQVTFSPESLMLELAALAVGAVYVPIPLNWTPEMVKQILQKSHAAFLVVPGQEAWEKTIDLLHHLSDLEHVLTLKPVRGDSEIQLDLDALENRGIQGLKRAKMYEPDASEGDLLEHASRNIEAERDAYIIHTSGSSGVPRPVPLNHRSLLLTAQHLANSFKGKLPAQTTVLQLLPPAHYSGCLGLLLQLAVGYQLKVPGPAFMAENAVREAQPHVLLTTPIILERLKKHAWKEIKTLSGIKKILADKSFDTTSGNKGWFSQLFSERIVQGKIREILGEPLHTIISTGSYLRPGLHEFYNALGIRIIDIYGLAEATGAVSISEVESTGEALFLGTARPGFEIRLSNQMEIQVSGKDLCKGYGYGSDDLEPDSANLFKDGWLQTGDLGQWQHKDHISYLERKQDLLITAAGKIVYPKKIEMLFADYPYFEHVVLFGHNRAFLTALITLEKEFLVDVPEIAHLVKGDTKVEGWFEHPTVLNWLGGLVSEINRALEPYQQIRKFSVLPQSLSAEKHEVNALGEPLRKPIQEHYAAVLEKLYEDEDQVQAFNVG